jgi:hypothetical protein
MAAPTMPASFCRVAGTTSVSTLMCGRYFSDFLLIPPPMMMRFGQMSVLYL